MKALTLKWIGLLALAGLVVTAGLACTKPPQAESPTPDPVATPHEVAPSDMTQQAKLMAAQTKFSFDLLAQLWQESPEETVIVSPLSVATALSMVYNGAAGDTQTAIAETLRLEGMTVEALNGAIANQLQTLNSDDLGATVSIANSLWAREGVTFNPSFIETAETFYAAEVASLDFTQPSALATINGWVEDKTEGMIPQIINQIKPDDVLFLINAVYFKGDWQFPFEPDRTQEEDFFTLDGTAHPHPLMAQSGEFFYSETDQFQAIRLPYQGGQLEMVVLLPQAEVSPMEMQSALTAEAWQQWMTQFSRRPGSLKLPKFKLEYGTQLNQVLAALGMDVAFDPNQADFSRLSDLATYISDVQHKTVIDVNETGTEAAAATSIGITATSAPVEPPQPFEMIVNRPFFLAIQDQQTQSMLFMGWVMDPTAE